MVSGCVMCFLYCCEWACPPFTAGPQSVLGQSLKASMSSWQAMSHSRFVTHHSSSALGGGVRGGGEVRGGEIRRGGVVKGGERRWGDPHQTLTV